MRLNKFLAQCGLGSRREVEEYIRYGLVSVNGEVVKTPGTTIDPQKDSVTFQGKRLKLPPFQYFAFYKPKYMLTTLKDPQGRPCVGDVVEHLPGRLFPVGRLDWQSEGLLLLTNDGDWAQKIMHPSYGVQKIYRVKVKGKVSPKTLTKMKKGITVRGHRYRVDEGKILSQTHKGHTWLSLTLHEGKSRHIRILMKSLGHPVLKLRREQIGGIKLGKLKAGEWRVLSPEEIAWGNTLGGKDDS